MAAQSCQAKLVKFQQSAEPHSASRKLRKISFDGIESQRRARYPTTLYVRTFSLDRSRAFAISCRKQRADKFPRFSPFISRTFPRLNLVPSRREGKRVSELPITKTSGRSLLRRSTRKKTQRDASRAKRTCRRVSSRGGGMMRARDDQAFFPSCLASISPG